jgi:hypothetical protein
MGNDLSDRRLMTPFNNDQASVRHLRQRLATVMMACRPSIDVCYPSRSSKTPIASCPSLSVPISPFDRHCGSLMEEAGVGTTRYRSDLCSVPGFESVHQSS